MSKQNWEEDLEILGLRRFNTGEWRLYEVKKLKKFVRRLIEKRKKEILKEILKKIPKKKKVEEKMVDNRARFYGDVDYGMIENIGYNEAIDEIKDKLKEV